jgi:acyl-CoA oxidase
MYVMATNADDALPKMVKDPAARTALVRLLELALLQNIREKGADFVGVLTSPQMRLVNKRINQLLLVLRPDAVALSDCFGFADSSLKSTVGRYDGNVYEAIYEEAKRSPLNTAESMVGWEKLKPMLDMDFIRENSKTQRHVPTSKM